MGLFDGTPLQQSIICDGCGQDEKLCACPPRRAVNRAEADVDPSRQQLKLRLEKRKRGKLVTTVSGFSGSQTQLQALLTELKHSCGAGGTLTAHTLELQGDHQSRLRQFLAAQGYRLS